MSQPTIAAPGYQLDQQAGKIVAADPDGLIIAEAEHFISDGQDAWTVSVSVEAESEAHTGFLPSFTVPDAYHATSAVKTVAGLFMAAVAR